MLPAEAFITISRMKSFTSHSIAETEKIAADWLEEAAKKHNKLIGEHPESIEATTVGLSGHLVAGKTAFVKAVAKMLGINETVTSPTFVIMKLYEIPLAVKAGGASESGVWPWKRLVHIDAYRLGRPEEMEALDFEHLVADPRNLIMLEWPENVQEALAGIENMQTIRFSAGTDDSREICF